MRSELKQKRIEKNLTQKQLASQLGIGTRFYQAIELGERKGRQEIWVKLCEILDAEFPKIYKNI